MKVINIWCDGACSGNPGPGGYASAIVHAKDRIEYSSGYSEYTTNNRMELLGFIESIKFAFSYKTRGKAESVIIHTDSKYVENAINCKWIVKWAGNGFAKIKNPDLWLEVYTLISKCDFIKVKWVKAHAGIFGNELVDGLATEAMITRRTSNGIIDI